MFTESNLVDPTQFKLHHFNTERAHACKRDLTGKLSVVGDSKLGEGLYKWIHDCQENLFFSTSIFKKGLGTCNLSFGLEVEAEPTDHPLWEEDINLFLDVHSKDQFWSQDIKAQKDWKYITVLNMTTTRSRHMPHEDNPINDLIKTLNVSNQSILIQSHYRLKWHQPKRGPKPEGFFFDPEMEASFVPRSRPAPARKIAHLLLVYSDQPLGSFVKTLIQQNVLGAIPGKPVWQTIRGQELQTMSSSQAFGHAQCKRAQLGLTAYEFRNMLTGNMLHEDKRCHFYGPFM